MLVAADAIASKLPHLPESPGVYMWKDADGVVLYVGKAKRLRSRVRSYLASDHLESVKTRALMRQAADIEDKSEKNIVTPGRLLPARELLGDMLMDSKRPAEALTEYEASQLREPDRYRGLYGAGQAAAQSGNSNKARQYFSKLVELAGSGDLRPELENARRYLASN